jgi:molybdopterin biosynthesis enzyme MoaB
MFDITPEDIRDLALVQIAGLGEIFLLIWTPYQLSSVGKSRGQRFVQS